MKEKSECVLFVDRVAAGFPSPASDYIEQPLDLNNHLIKNPAATFFVRTEGDSMVGAGIYSGDILIIDRSLQAVNNSVVLAVVDGEFTVKRMVYENNRIVLMPENAHYAPIVIYDSMDFSVWGVVTTVIHSFV